MTVPIINEMFDFLCFEGRLSASEKAAVECLFDTWMRHDCLKPNQAVELRDIFIKYRGEA